MVSEVLIKHISTQKKELKKGKIYCGRETFFDIPNDIITAHFEYKYGNYFKNFSTCIMGPNFF